MDCSTQRVIWDWNSFNCRWDLYDACRDNFRTFFRGSASRPAGLPRGARGRRSRPRPAKRRRRLSCRLIKSHNELMLQLYSIFICHVWALPERMSVPIGTSFQTWIGLHPAAGQICWLSDRQWMPVCPFSMATIYSIATIVSIGLYLHYLPANPWLFRFLDLILVNVPRNIHLEMNILEARSWLLVSREFHSNIMNQYVL